MPTVQHVVAKLVAKQPFIEEALSRGLINNAALANYYLKIIEKELGKEVKFSAVNMAVRRLADSLEASESKEFHFSEHAGITLKSDLVEITVYKTADIHQYTQKMYDLVRFSEGDFLTITEGLHEIMIITNTKYEKLIRNLFPNKSIKHVIKDLTSITINIPPEAVEEVGMFYLVTRTFSWENIPIVDIVSTFTEMTYILEEQYASKAFDALTQLIKGK